MACEMVRLEKPGRQGRMMKYHPSRRLELVAVDIYWHLWKNWINGHLYALISFVLETRSKNDAWILRQMTAHDPAGRWLWIVGSVFQAMRENSC
jgi:hypothetical protein